MYVKLSYLNLYNIPSFYNNYSMQSQQQRWRNAALANACGNFEPTTSGAYQYDTTVALLVQALNDGHNAVWDSKLPQN